MNIRIEPVKERFFAPHPYVPRGERSVEVVVGYTYFIDGKEFDPFSRAIPENLGVPDLYATEQEWLLDPEPYGTYVMCRKCGTRVEIQHVDVFHEGRCTACGEDVGDADDAPCMRHAIIRGRCQALK